MSWPMKVNRHSFVAPALVLVALVVAPDVHAAFWDDDSLAVEVKQRPAVAELVMSRVARHSRLYYEHLEARSRPLTKNADATAETFDELALAQFQQGRTLEAIVTLMEKMRRFGEDFPTSIRVAVYQADLDLRPDAREQLARARSLAGAAELESVRVLEDLLALRDRPDKGLSSEREFQILGMPWAHPLAPPGQTSPGPDRTDAIAFLIRTGLDRDPSAWLGLGRALFHSGASRLAMWAFWHAERVGHPLGGGEFCETTKRFRSYAIDGAYCWRGRKVVESHIVRAVKARDRKFASEDALLRAGKAARVFRDAAPARGTGLRRHPPR
jgi:hypothetical protein